MTIKPLEPPHSFLNDAAALNIEFDPGDVNRFGLFLALLLDANTRFNLTANTDPIEVWRQHILDSLSLMPFVTSSNASSVIDIGSGAGLPGIPLAIAIPQLQFTLLEATGKKARYLQETIATLGLSNVEVINERAESIGQDHKNYRERFDVAIARAVGPLPVLLELAIPLVRVGGHLFAIKGEKAQSEVKESKQALHALHSHVIEMKKTPTGTIVVVEKLRKSPRLYPRAPGEPKRVPLGTTRNR